MNFSFGVTYFKRLGQKCLLLSFGIFSVGWAIGNFTSHSKITNLVLFLPVPADLFLSLSKQIVWKVVFWTSLGYFFLHSLAS